MERRHGQSQVSFDLLPSICEYREFGSDEDYQGTGRLNSKLIKTRNAFPAFTQRFEEDEEPEEERPLLRLYSRYSKVGNEEWKPQPQRPKLARGRKVQKRRLGHKVWGQEWKPKVAKGWKMQKRRVRIAWAKSHRCRQSVRSSVKALSDCSLLLLKTMRDAYVSVMTRMANKCNQRMWYLAGARLL